MNQVPTEQELLNAFKKIQTTDLKVNAIYCAVCGQGVNFKTKEGQLCNHLRKDFEGIIEKKSLPMT